jgi:FlaA1/EpsC-like NDP-sugar epimerase
MKNGSNVPAMRDLFGPEGSPADRRRLPEGPFRGETVLLSGAGGSLGRPVARRLAELPLEGLLLLDTSEHGLTTLENDLEDRLGREAPRDEAGGSSPELGPDPEYLLADLRVEADRKRALRAAPTAVIHAAAYKHVPFLEKRPIPAAQNNLLATADWLWACRAAPSVERFTLVSTDKAAAPTGVMGATKAGCERLLRSARQGPEPGLVPTTIRLCNVFGSRGSVVPRFCRRLREGRPLPVTDPEMERRFIGPEGAAEAVLRASVLGGGTYVPRAGRTVSVGELARRLIGWARPGANPEEWIRVVGSRPGERRHERLLSQPERPPIPVDGGLLRAREPRNGEASRDRNVSQNGQAGARPPLRETLEQLRRCCRGGDEGAVRRLLERLAVHPEVSTPERRLSEEFDE